MRTSRCFQHRWHDALLISSCACFSNGATIPRGGSNNQFKCDSGVGRCNEMDTLGIEPKASRMLSGCDTTTPRALNAICMRSPISDTSQVPIAKQNTIHGKRCNHTQQMTGSLLTALDRRIRFRWAGMCARLDCRFRDKTEATGYTRERQGQRPRRFARASWRTSVVFSRWP